MVGADDFVLDIELVAQTDVEARCENDKPRRNVIAIRII